jgi:hypothetical protein
MSKLVTIKDSEGEPMGNVDEHTGIARMRARCPNFFRTKHGGRETYTVHRGQLIVRGTVQFTDSRPERRTVVYLYCVDGDLEDDTFCVSTGYLTTVAQAKKLIDRILDGGRYTFAMDRVIA